MHRYMRNNCRTALYYNMKTSPNTNPNPNLYLKKKHAQSAELRIRKLYPLQIGKTFLSDKRRYPGYDTKLHLIVQFPLWRFGECELSLHCHYSQVHSEKKW